VWGGQVLQQGVPAGGLEAAQEDLPAGAAAGAAAAAAVSAAAVALAAGSQSSERSLVVLWCAAARPNRGVGLMVRCSARVLTYNWLDHSALLWCP
jgi:hypothetical protein